MNNDDLLEAKIDHARLLFATAETPRHRRLAWASLQRLIAQRSQARISEMEREQGPKNPAPLSVDEAGQR